MRNVSVSLNCFVKNNMKTMSDFNRSKWLSKAKCLETFLELFDFLSKKAEMKYLLETCDKAFTSYLNDSFQKLKINIIK